MVVLKRVKKPMTIFTEDLVYVVRKYYLHFGSLFDQFLASQILQLQLFNFCLCILLSLANCTAPVALKMK